MKCCESTSKRAFGSLLSLSNLGTQARGSPGPKDSQITRAQQVRCQLQCRAAARQKASTGAGSPSHMRDDLQYDEPSAHILQMLCWAQFWYGVMCSGALLLERVTGRLQVNSGMSGECTPSHRHSRQAQPLQIPAFRQRARWILTSLPDS